MKPLLPMALSSRSWHLSASLSPAPPDHLCAPASCSEHTGPFWNLTNLSPRHLGSSRSSSQNALCPHCPRSAPSDRSILQLRRPTHGCHSHPCPWSPSVPDAFYVCRAAGPTDATLRSTTLLMPLTVCLTHSPVRAVSGPYPLPALVTRSLVTFSLQHLKPLSNREASLVWAELMQGPILVPSKEQAGGRQPSPGSGALSFTLGGLACPVRSEATVTWPGAPPPTQPLPLAPATVPAILPAILGSDQHLLAQNP